MNKTFLLGALIFVVLTPFSHSMQPKIPPCTPSRPFILLKTLSHRFSHGDTQCASIHLASERGCIHCLTAIIEGERDEITKAKLIETRNDQGLTPLHSAIIKNQPQTAALLIRNNACKEAEISQAHGYWKGYKPLQLAIIHGNRACIMLLLRHGADYTSAWPFANNYSPEVLIIYEQVHGNFMRGWFDDPLPVNR